jgi:hypothetical protein
MSYSPEEKSVRTIDVTLQNDEWSGDEYHDADRAGYFQPDTACVSIFPPSRYTVHAYTQLEDMRENGHTSSALFPASNALTPLFGSADYTRKTVRLVRDMFHARVYYTIGRIEE